MTIRLSSNDVIDLIVPPGLTLSEELSARDMTQRELAMRMGRSHTVVNDIIHGRKSITADTAIQLEAALEGVPAEFWLDLQSRYDLDIARQRLSTAAT